MRKHTAVSSLIASVLSCWTGKSSTAATLEDETAVNTEVPPVASVVVTRPKIKESLSAPPASNV